jgi:hypothetical protein
MDNEVVSKRGGEVLLFAIGGIVGVVVAIQHFWEAPWSIGAWLILSSVSGVLGFIFVEKMNREMPAEPHDVPRILQHGMVFVFALLISALVVLVANCVFLAIQDTVRFITGV